MTRTILVDADVLVYQAGFSCEVEAEWAHDLWTWHCDFNEALQYFEDRIADYQEKLKADRVVMALSSPNNFRKELLPSYKSNRKNTRKPLVYRPLREHIAQEYECYERDGLEGDDILGILSTHPKLIPGEKIIVSVDKDMGTIPGRWLNDGRARDVIAEHGGEYEDYIQTTTEEEADRWHLIQTLAGDQSDGYAGAPGYGTVTAERLLEAGLVLEPHEHEFKSGPRKGQKEIRWQPGHKGNPWEIIVSAYASKGLSEEVALTTARVARICRWRDWNFKEKRVRLWQPQF